MKSSHLFPNSKQELDTSFANSSYFNTENDQVGEELLEDKDKKVNHSEQMMAVTSQYNTTAQPKKALISD